MIRQFVLILTILHLFPLMSYSRLTGSFQQKSTNTADTVSKKDTVVLLISFNEKKDTSCISRTLMSVLEANNFTVIDDGLDSNTYFSMNLEGFEDKNNELISQKLATCNCRYVLVGEIEIQPMYTDTIDQNEVVYRGIGIVLYSQLVSTNPYKELDKFNCFASNGGYLGNRLGPDQTLWNNLDEAIKRYFPKHLEEKILTNK